MSKLSNEQIEAVVAWIDNKTFCKNSIVGQDFRTAFTNKTEIPDYLLPGDPEDWEPKQPFANDVYSQLNAELDSIPLPTEEEWTRKRKEDLRNEVLRYIYRRKQVPEGWINELNRLNK